MVPTGLSMLLFRIVDNILQIAVIFYGDISW